jgi:hypothetical protein
MLAVKRMEEAEDAMRMRIELSTFIFILIFTISIAVAGQSPPARAGDKSAANKFTHTVFEDQVARYTSRREELERELPPLAKRATAEEIVAHKNALLKKVQADRKGVVRGNIFTPDAERLIRAIIVRHYPGRTRMELKKELSEAATKGVPMKVNGVYPETAELVETPPTLLLVLPQLPEHVRYRFVGTNLLIVDRDTHLIVDYMANALP